MAYQLVLWKGDSNRRDDQDEDVKFVGLGNQGATCYMNSLLQTLFMSPEFRQCIYRWNYDPEKHGDPKDSIPYQLQFLFTQLQLQEDIFVDTNHLTKSFGWDIREGFQQQDVQEFCRVLFDAIEESVEGTPMAKMINNLYEGKMIDYVKCQECGYESSRQDNFLDLSLTVRNEFDKIYNDSVEKALENYIKPDELSGDNQYNCSQCNKKTDALKGLKFKQLPYILALQLKRFDLDLQTFQRIKLNDKVTFPYILNMNPYMNENATVLSRQGTLAEKSKKKKKDFNEELQYSNFDITPPDLNNRQFVQKKYHNVSDYIIEDDDKFQTKLDHIARLKHIEKETEERQRKQEELIQQYKEEGDNVYELYSVMIHSGGALGGHYYAYIKDFATSRWFCFNDTQVRGIQEKDIKKAFGGSSKSGGAGFNSMWSSSANAYLLMYRRVQNDNLNIVPKEDIPSYIIEAIEVEKERERKLMEERQERSKNVQLKVYYDGKEQTIWAKKDQPLKELKEKIKEKFDLKVEDSNMRIRSYQYYNDVMLDVYDDEKTLEEQQIFNLKSLAVETKTDDEEFNQYDPNSMQVKVILWKDEYEESDESIVDKCTDIKKVSIDKRYKIRDLIEKLSELFEIPTNKLKIIKKAFMGNNSFPENISSRAYYDHNMSQARVYEGSILLIEEMENTMLKSKWQFELDREMNRLNIRFNHPDDKPNYMGHNEFKYSIMIDSKKTVQDLKTMIANKLQLKEDEFVIKRGSKNSMEVKDLSLKLTQASVMNGSLFFIERGKPQLPDEYRLIFYYAKILKQHSDDGTCYGFYELFELPVNQNLEVNELKEKLVQKVHEEYPTLRLEKSKIRLRERQADRLQRVLINEKVLKDYQLYEKKNIAIQLLEEEEVQLQANEMIAIVRRWHQSTWEISEPVEVIISKSMKLFQFGEILSRQFGIAEENIELARIGYAYNFTRLQLKTEQFYRTKNANNELNQAPWFINMDGSLFFVKDRTEALKELTYEEKQKYQRSTQMSYSGPSRTISFKYERPKEQGVSIKVKKHQQNQEAKVEENKKEEEKGETATQATETD